VAFMLVDTSSWYLADTTLLFGELANHYAVLSTGQPRLPRGFAANSGAITRHRKIRMAMDWIVL
jgi:hypothetical protein